MHVAGERGAAQRAMIIPGPGDPFGSADAYAETCARGGRPLRRWRGDWYVHEGTRWSMLEDDDVRADMVEWLMDVDQRVEIKGAFVPWKPTRDGQIKDVLAALGDICHRSSKSDQTPGMFLSNLWLDADMKPTDYSPLVFNTSVASYRWEVKAECRVFLAWLNDIFSPGDVAMFRQWLGYLVSGRIDLQKMLVIIGPRRSGKGTLLWLMEELLGPGSTASIADLGAMSKTFGLEPLVGARLAVMPDVRWNTKDASDAVPHILSITGTDSRDVNRKNRSVWRGRLGVRFVACSNDTPSLADASGALAGRMLMMSMDKSFYGREDPGLPARLKKELPGILQWALGGLRELEKNGRFQEPESSAEAREEVRQAGNPTYLFIEDECKIGPFGMVTLDVLYLAYENWCKRYGHRALSAHTFSRQLQNTYRGRIKSDRRRHPDTGERERILRGVTLSSKPLYSPEALYELGEPG
jgi:putative DNA primase/helicase